MFLMSQNLKADSQIPSIKSIDSRRKRSFMEVQILYYSGQKGKSENSSLNKKTLIQILLRL